MPTFSALHICADPDKLIAAAEEFDLQKMRELSEGPARQRLDRARGAFESWAAFSGAKVKWVEHVGSISSSLLAETRDATLIAIARPHNLDSADALHAAIFNSGRLVLFVPTDGALPATMGEHIIVAWKPYTQARRTVIQATPWLRAAKRVTVVTVDEAHPDQADADVLALLGNHDIVADVRHARSGARQHIAERLLSEADDLAADAIVMGAFRFGQIFEWVFGGVTHEVLRRTRLPVFMMH